MEIGHINTAKLTRHSLAVKILKVESPNLIWIHIRNGEETFQELRAEMQWKMARQAKYLICYPDDILVDEAVAIREANHWHRGQILQIRDWKAYIALKDWGRSVWRPFNECYRLLDRFRELEWQTVPCDLARIKPTQDTNTWPRSTRQITKAIAEKKVERIQIKKAIKDTAAYVDLAIDNSPRNGDYDLGHILTQLGHTQEIPKAGIDLSPGITGELYS
ncbi:hypothetical protein X777_09150 [Ooceraea biroi]|uniref:Tudor domain-containing protein n=1 Tax=Ooceraea biroi TaxID=2015173 RepID=A0A026X0J7_OOCBI|nr:hypothetical protein X777_09150 [Ooceraea biroi]